MIRITSANLGDVLLLPEAQVYALEGKNTFIIHDNTTLRMQPYGAKLGNLAIEGYEVMPRNSAGKTGLERKKEILDYFDNSIEGSKMDQFIIEYVKNQSDKFVVNTEKDTVFRGVLSNIVFHFNVEKPTIINYRILFNVYPYKRSDKKISNVYWMSQ